METSKAENRPSKRKLNEIIQSLDDAVANPVDRPTPPKRQSTVKSLYSTLSKYGINSKGGTTTSGGHHNADLSKTPLLAAILSRTSHKPKSGPPYIRRSAVASPSDYRPSSTPSFLARLETYKLSTYSNKPQEIAAVAAARCGWVNDGKDRLRCGICHASWVVAGREKMSREAANALIKKQQQQLVDNHKEGCPWKVRQCDADIYRVRLSSPTAMLKEIKLRALMLESLVADTEVKHPLTTSQLQALVKAIASVKLRDDLDGASLDDSPESVPQEQAPPSPSPEPSSPAIIAALFGWSLAPPTPPISIPRSRPVSRPSTPSRSRASSVAPSAPSVPATPRRSSAYNQPRDSPSPLTPSLLRVNSRLSGTPRSSVAPELNTPLLHCSLCHRRLGLWPSSSSQSGRASTPANAPSRQIDVLREHRSYCPYVTRSAIVPSLPVQHSHSSDAPSLVRQPGDLVEGWRAVTLVVLRHRMGQKQWDSVLANLTGSQDTNGRSVEGESDVEMDPVQAMVDDVKSKGGLDLLKYVKGLLG